MKKALLVTYYWPPAAGPGVHRWLRFSRYFHELGWNLTVYCPENGEWPVTDDELIKSVPKDIEVIRRPIFEPHKFLGKKNNPNKGGAFTSDKKPGIKQRFIMWVRGNLFIPDARMFWIQPSAKFLINYLKKHPEITTLITTGPPHSMHLIGEKVKAATGIHWVADFRDPWTQIDFYNDLMLSKRADEKHHKLEKKVLQTADVVVTISNQCAIGLENSGQRKVEVITNGFDFPIFEMSEFQADSNFTIAHFGSMPAARNPKVLWHTLSRMVKEVEHFSSLLSIKLLGPVDQSVFQSIEENGLTPFLSHISYVSHSESIEMQRKTPVLLLVANDAGNTKGILTGKVFEYLGANRFILAIGEEQSDLEEVINKTKSGVLITRNNINKCFITLSQVFQDFQDGKTVVYPQNLEPFSSRYLAAKFISFLK